MSRKNILIALGVVLVGAARRRREPLVQEGQGPHGHHRSRSRRATSKRSSRRRARFSRSGSSTSAPTRSGRVVDLAVNEGDRSRRASSCCRSTRSRCSTRVDSGTASLRGGARRRSTRCGRRSKPRASQLEQAQQNLTRQQDLWKQQLTTREALEKAENDVQGRRVGAAGAREAGRRRRTSRIKQERATLESARYDLSKVRIESPIDGIVTRRNIQEGETAVIGTMNNAGTVLLSSPTCRSSRRKSKSTRPTSRTCSSASRRRSRSTRFPTGRSRATSPRSATARFRRPAGARPATQATNFKVVVVLDEPMPDVRPGSPARPTSRPRRASTSSRCRFRRSPSASWSTTPTARS